MGKWIKAAEISQIAPGQGRLIKVAGQEIALFNVAGAFYAISNTCPHSTGPLVEGRLFGTVVTCPWHGSQFDVTNGQCQAGPAVHNVATYPVQVEDQAIFIEINQQK